MRRKNYLDVALCSVFSTQKLKSWNIYTRNLLLVVCYASLEEEYLEGNKPSQEQLAEYTLEILKTHEINEREEISKGIVRLGTVTREAIFATAKTVSERRALEYFHPEYMVDYLDSIFSIEESTEVMVANNTLKKSWLRINTSKVSDSKELITELDAEGIEVSLDPDFPDLLELKKWQKTPIMLTEAYRTGKFVIQSKPSVAVIHILDPRPNEIVVDMTAAPGMKATHIGQFLGNTGHLILAELSKKRLVVLVKTWEKLQLPTPITIINCDSKFIPIRSNSVDKVLIDAPCSATGIYSMYPDHKWRDKRQVKNFARIQRALVEEGIRILKLGGIGVFSTCSLRHEEGEVIITNLRKKIEILPIKQFSRPIYRCYQKMPNGHPYPKDVQLNCRRTYGHRSEVDNFFFARFRKIIE